MTFAQVAALVDAEAPRKAPKYEDGSLADLARLEGLTSRG